MKTCLICKEFKEFSQFPVRYDTKKGQGVVPYCKFCFKEYRRKIRFKHLYGLSWKQLELLEKESENKCSICGSLGGNTTFTRLVLDHNHKTNKVRKFLCQSCNKGLGNFKDNIEIMKNAIKYLEENA